MSIYSVLHVDYIAQVYYSPSGYRLNSWIMKFIVTKYLNAYISVSTISLVSSIAAALSVYFNSAYTIHLS